jgi:hypothetical protein
MIAQVKGALLPFAPSNVTVFVSAVAAHAETDASARRRRSVTVASRGL